MNTLFKLPEHSGKLRPVAHFKPAPLAVAIAAGLMASLDVSAAQKRSEQDIETIGVVAAKEVRNPSSDKFTRPLLDTAQTVNVISEDLIEQRAATTLRDVLRNVSGISMQAGEGGTPPGDQLSIRGHSARTDIFVDGVRDFGGYTRDPFNLEQVEVVKGPSSDYSGRGSTGGSINLVSKSPSLEDNTQANFALGSDSFSRLTLDTNQRIDSIDGAATRLNLMYHNQGIAGRDEVKNERWGIAPSIAFGLDSDTRVTLSLFHLQQDNVPDYGIPWVPASNVPLADYADQPAPVDSNNWYGLLARDFEEVGTTMATVNINHRIADNMSLSNTTRYGITDRDSMVTAPRFANTDSTDIRRSDEKYRDQEDDIISNQTNLVMDFGGAREHRVLVGAEFTLEGEKRHTQELTGSDSPATDLYNPNPHDPYLENYQRTGTASVADSTSVAAYISDSVQLNERWQINGSLRWDRFDLEYTPDGSPRMERADTMLSYRAGIVFKPVKEGSVYFGYGTSFNPTAEALSISTSSRRPGIADLDPEENTTIELGTKWELMNRQLFVSAAIFRTEKTNARTQDLDDPNDLLVLEGEQLVQGFEAGISGHLLERLNIYAGYTYLDTEVTESKNPSEIGHALANSPQHSFNWWSTYQVDENLQLGLGAQFVDDRFNRVPNTRVAPSYWTCELSASYTVSDRLSFRLNVQNVLDEDFIDYVGGGHFIPGMARVALLSSTFRF